jgi:diguanylate cyclase (GGDEF)-like protein
VSATPIALTAVVERHLSVSIGVAAISPSRDETEFKALTERLLAEADAALYRAKAMGRNRVQMGST